MTYCIPCKYHKPGFKYCKKELLRLINHQDSWYEDCDEFILKEVNK